MKDAILHLIAPASLAEMTLAAVFVLCVAGRAIGFGG